MFVLPPTIKLPVLACLAIAVCTQANFAATNPEHSTEAPGDNSNAETVRVIGDRQTAIQSTHYPSSTLVSSTTLNSALAEHFNQLGRLAPGTWISRGEGIEHLTAIRSPVYTGAGACGTYLASEDGIPLTAKNFCNVNQLMLSNINAADSMTVTRGPQADLFGGNALFGSIQTQTLAAALASKSATPPSQSVRTSVGSLGRSSGNYTFLMGRSEDTYSSANGGRSITRIGFNANATHDTGWRDNSSYGQQFFQGAAITRSGKFSATHSLTIMNLEQETAGYLYGEDAYKDPQRASTNDYPEAYRNAKAIRGYSRLHFLTANDFSVSLTPYFRHNEMAFLMHFVPWQPTETNQHTSLGMQLETSKAYGLFDLQAGQDIELTKGSLSEIQYQAAPFNQAGFPEGEHYDYTVDALNAGWYVKGAMALADPLSLEVAVRWDVDSLDYTNRLATGFACENPNNCRFYRPESSKDTFRALSPSMTVNYRFNGHTRLYLRAAKGFRTPQATELYRLQSSTQNHLAKVTGRSMEAGIQTQLKSLNLGFTAYRMKVDDDIILDSNRMYVNGINTLHAGIEYKAVWDIRPSISARFVGTYAKHTYRNSSSFGGRDHIGKELDTAPRNIHSGMVLWQINHQSRMQLEVDRMGSYYTDPQETETYEGHSLVNVLYGREVNRTFGFNVKVSNLFNAHYAERADYSFGDPRYFPGQERRVTIALDFNF